MALTPAQREARQRTLGSSDAAAVLGRDPFERSAYDVWAEKTGTIQPGEEPQSMTPAKLAGTYIERGLLDWVDDQRPPETPPLERHLQIFAPDQVRHASLDGFRLVGPQAIVEAKAIGAGVRLPPYFADFGEAGTDQLPAHVIIQVAHQFAVLRDLPAYAEVRLALVPVFIVGRGFQLFELQRDDELCDVIVEEEVRFWRDHVLTGDPPPDAVGSMATLKALPRLDEETMPFDEAASAEVRMWKQLTADRIALEEAEEVYKRRVLTRMGQCAQAVCVDGAVVTFKEQSRKETVIPASTFRVLRYKNPPRGKD